MLFKVYKYCNYWFKGERKIQNRQNSGLVLIKQFLSHLGFSQKFIFSCSNNNRSETHPRVVRARANRSESFKTPKRASIIIIKYIY